MQCMAVPEDLLRSTVTKLRNIIKPTNLVNHNNNKLNVLKDQSTFISTELSLS